MAQPVPRLRADARRNRDQILAGAKRAFAERGPDVPMEDIAREAGVGVGTLYRRFPDREALILAVAEDNLAEVHAELCAAVVEEPSAWDALVRFLHQSRALQLTVRIALTSPTADAIIRDDPSTREHRRNMLELLDEVVRAAQGEGTLRPDVGLGDVVTLIALLLGRVQSMSDEAPTGAERALLLVVDGLRARPGTPLPGSPLTAKDLTSAPRSSSITAH